MMGGVAAEVVVEDAAAAAAAVPAAAVAGTGAGGGEEGRMRMEGWLYLIRSNRLGLQYSRKRYFVLEDAAFRCFKAPPPPSSSSSSSKREDPVRSAIIDSCIRVTDNGRESVHRSVFYIFTLYNASNHYDQLKLGARSSEEAARWIRCLMESALKSPRKDEHIVACSHRRWQAFRLSRRSNRMHSIDWTVFSSVHNDPMASDVIAPSPWTIFGCKNGLRLFTEAKDGGSEGKYWDDHPAIMAVGVVDANSEAVFQTVMSLGQSRSEWDFCLQEGRVVEHIDGHTDIIHKKLRDGWLPWGMRKRDLLLRRYWRREDDGTYVILYHSVFHYRCRSERGYVRACLKSGGYVISPVNQGKQSVVKHMLAIDWKFWKSYLFTASAKHITIRMLGRVAALREFFRAKNGNCACIEFSSGELTRDMRLQQGENERIKIEMLSASENNRLEDPTEGSLGGSNRHLSSAGSFIQLNDAADEFFDVPDDSEYDQREAMWPSDESTHSVDQRHAKLSTAAVFVKKLHDLAVQKRGYVDLQGAADFDNGPFCYGYTLPKDSNCTMPSTWAMTDPTTFLIRGESYLQDRLKIKANNTLMQMVGADWIKSDKREDDLAGRPGGLVQKCAAQGGNKFFFIVNIQVPGSSTYSLALYYMMDTPLEKVPLLERFVNGDDAFRNSRFKLIPYISKGSWIVKQSVGKKACLVGQALEINYFRGSNYLELGVDIGSSTVARGVVSLVLGYLNNLVIEMAFLVQGNTQEELPEFLLGTCRLNYLDASKAVSIDEC
ncbi:protein ENHANCED DISEASE RESISTANCE 2-like isoform X2 [Oryza glaberrima]|uniref:protein ENHANCED DISEASE RESISTANCE 2-like isoform X2 n=1 Tax=Oryza glaberrima TaxID=4538 RepID=UPI00224C080F|nr:protein ENHANCED DISEASE RESISTANCE 2-like isoform X2 [Oryza glaberrima]